MKCDPPLPIPNREVKAFYSDDTWPLGARESRICQEFIAENFVWGAVEKFSPVIDPSLEEKRLNPMILGLSGLGKARRRRVNRICWHRKISVHLFIPLRPTKAGKKAFYIKSPPWMAGGVVDD